MAAAPDVVVRGEPFVLLVEATATPALVVAAGTQGPPGRQGEPGPEAGSAFQRVAGETLSALRVVYELAGQVFKLDARDGERIDLLLGVTLTAAQQGDTINVQRSGAIDDAGWSWQPGLVWLGADGALTQQPPVDGFAVLIGAAVSATRITLNIQPGIQLEQE
ncbi:hypothetical protein [Ectopseudomonas mendocina]|uniref:Uncharacterized protein n=1 Tax=Ectopseudomonas mendocina TaxID=300 RepID=A0A2R3QWS0_ECTME|nr:hypothetical protein [Pseudomonas mendocina]AVO56160.1 hypothetical protein C7A17_26595 [Pseudomonas mendocina]